MPDTTSCHAARAARSAIAGSAIGLTLLVGASAAAQDVTLRVHHFLPTQSTTHARFIEPWAERVEAQSDGRIAVEIYPAMQLGGSPPALYDQAREGVVDIVWTLPGYTPGRFPMVEVFELPFVAAGAEATSQAVQEFYEHNLAEEFADVHVLMLHAHAPGTFHIRGPEVVTLEDLEGLKVRGPTRVSNAALEALGAVPVGMPVPQVPEALSRGVVEATVIPWEVALPLRVHELVNTHTQIGGDRGFYTAVFLFAMNKQVYDGLPDDLRTVIDANSGLALAQEIGRVWDEAEIPGRQAAVDAGNTIVTLAPEEVERWRDVTQPVIDAWIAETNAAGVDGQALLDEARALVAKYVDGG